jgi:hypothetical protein
MPPGPLRGRPQGPFALNQRETLAGHKQREMNVAKAKQVIRNYTKDDIKILKAHSKAKTPIAGPESRGAVSVAIASGRACCRRLAFGGHPMVNGEDQFEGSVDYRRNEVEYDLAI